MVACSAMAAAKEQEQEQENASPKSKWEKWKRGGIIGAAALTGGALLAITGGRTKLPIIYLLKYKHIDSSLGHTAPRRLICSQPLLPDRFSCTSYCGRIWCASSNTWHTCVPFIGASGFAAMAAAAGSVAGSVAVAASFGGW